MYLERLNASQEEAEEVELRYYTEQEIQASAHPGQSL